VIDANGPKTSKETIISKIKEQSTFSFTYFLLLFTSTIIATLGLLTNNGTVVIGAMLIAPIFWPVLGISLGAVKNDHKVLFSTTISLVFTIALVLSVSSVLTMIFPFEQTNREILSRTQPTIIHLLIALTSSAIGIAALYYKKISSSASGAAISIALLPPLCVAGIGITTKSWPIFSGASFLFITSTITIIFTGIVSLYLFKIRPYFKKDKTVAATSLTISLLLLLILSIPLTLYLRLAVNQKNISVQVTKIIQEQVKDINIKAKADDIVVTFPQVYNTKNIEITATIYIPESTEFDLSHQQKIVSGLSEVVNIVTNLRLNIIKTVDIHKNDKDLLVSEQAQSIVNSYLSELDTNAQLSNYSFIREDDENVNVELQLFYTDDLPITYEQKVSLEKELSEKLSLNVNLSIRLISSQEIIMKKYTNRQIEEILSKYIVNINSIQNVSVIDNEIKITLNTLGTVEISDQQKEELEIEVQGILNLEDKPSVILVITPIIIK